MTSINDLDPDLADIAWAFDPMPEEWRDQPIPLEEARRWHALEAAPALAAAWHAAGIDSRLWRRLRPINEVLRWLDLGFTTEEVLAWLGSVPAWRTGLSIMSEMAWVWHHAGYDPNQVSRLWCEGWRNPADVAQYDTPGEANAHWDGTQTVLWTAYVNPDLATDSFLKEAAATRTDGRNIQSPHVSRVALIGGTLMSMGVPAPWLIALYDAQQATHPLRRIPDLPSLSSSFRALVQWHELCPDAGDLPGFVFELLEQWPGRTLSDVATWVHYGHGPEAAAAHPWMDPWTPERAAVIYGHTTNYDRATVLLQDEGGRWTDPDAMVWWLRANANHSTRGL